MMTLKELKKRVPVADKNGSVLGKTELLNSGAKIVVKEMVDTGVEISVFDNGYVLFEEDKHKTIFCLHSCKGYDYGLLDEKENIFGEEFFENENWYILPLMIGMDRVEASRKRILSNHNVISIDAENHDFFSHKALSMPEMTDEILWHEMLREFAELQNERQMYAVTAYYCEGISQAEIAENLEISQQAASGLIQRALVVIRNYLNINPSDVKRKRNKK